ncbi:MAG: hypothetical protein V1774_11680 [Candidatus Eisenbacteria bacterium]
MISRAWMWAALVGTLCLAAPAWAGEHVTTDGVEHVVNKDKPKLEAQTLRLEKVWSAGGPDGEALFGLITQAIVDESGNVYLLDTQLSEVQVYSPAGEQVKTLSREGEGPGEVRTPTDLFFLPDGRLGLVQAFPGKVVTVDREGNPGGTITVGGTDPTAGGFMVLLDGSAAGGNLVLAGIHLATRETSQDRTSFLASFTLEGVERTRYLERKSVLDFQNFKIVEKDQYFVYPRRWAVGPQGEVYAAPERDAYVIQVYSPEGKLVRVIERAFEPRPRTEKEMARVEAVAEAQTRQIPIEVEMNLEKTEPAITSIHARPNGELWVASSRSIHGQPAGIMVTFDVFDKQGDFSRQVAVACDGDGIEDGLFFAGSGHMLLVKGLADAAVSMQGATLETAEGEEPAPMEAVYYRIAG